MTKANILDRAIGWVAPAAAARRMQSRALLEVSHRGYEAATTGRDRDPWYSSNASADAEISKAGPALREAMRNLVRNNPYAANAIGNLVTHAVGSGIVPRSKDKRVNALFAEWARKCDAAGHLDFFGLQALVVRGLLESGDGIVRRRLRFESDGLPVPLQLQVLEPDHIDTSKCGTYGNTDIFEGIGVDPIGRPSEYWLFRQHPGAPRGMYMESAPVPAADIAHGFEKQRASQSRGKPWGTPAITHMRDLAEYERAETLRKKLEACLVGVVTGGGDDPGVTDLNVDENSAGVYNARGDIVERFEPGAFYHARGGSDIKFTQPATTGNYDTYKVSKLHDIAAGFRVPYSLLSGNLSKVNYSSGKIGLETYKRTIESLQWDVIIPMILDPIWDWFCQAAFETGRISQRKVPVQWSPPRFPSADEAKDIAARVKAMRAGLLNPMVAMAETGYAPDEIIEGYVEWNSMLDKHGLIFDSDPRRLSQVGQVQQEPPDKEVDDDDE